MNGKPLFVTVLSMACTLGLSAQDAHLPAFDIAAADQSAQPAGYNDPPPPPPGVPSAVPNAAGIPEKLTIKPGTFLTVRVNQWLSSDRNQSGDTFYATLADPLVVDGVVVARRGATVMGRISEAKKAGRIEGTSSLGLQLTNLTLVDGNQVSIASQVMDRKGTTSVGRDATAVGTTTAMGAAIGASADRGTGAAIGAGAGAVASVVGVLLTRGRPTEVYPETLLTFRLDGPVEVNTTVAPAAFHYANQEDFGATASSAPRVSARRQPGPMAGGPVYSPYPYPVWGPVYGPSVGVVFGRRFGGRW